MKTLHRYLLREVLATLVLTVGVFTAVYPTHKTTSDPTDVRPAPYPFHHEGTVLEEAPPGSNGAEKKNRGLRVTFSDHQNVISTISSE